MTFKILNFSTNKIINRSNVRSTNDNKSLNLQDNTLASPEVIASLRDDHFEDEESASEPTTENSSSTSLSTKPMPMIEPQDIVGRIFLLDKEGGQRRRDRIIKSVDEV